MFCIGKQIMKELYENAGFVDDYYNRTSEFFLRYYKDINSVFSFFDSVFENDSVDNNPRKMMNQIVRWVGLAEDLHKIRPANDPLIILCVRLCIEAICNLASSSNDKISFFEKNLSSDELNCLTNRLK